jgi:hypothetical protein
MTLAIPTRTLAIIGTAGRRDDAQKLTVAHWAQMVKAASEVRVIERVDHFVSGGAAWSDHVAVALAEQVPTGITIWMPAYERDLSTAAYYHRAFSRVLGHDTQEEIRLAGANNFARIFYFKGFKDRNTKVAEQAQCFLAMTFGHGAQVADGGTADTVRKMRAAGKTGYHFDLNDFTLHKVA